MKVTTARRGNTLIQITVPPYLLWGLPCPLCGYPAWAWFPQKYVDHGYGVGCLFDGGLTRVQIPVNPDLVEAS